MQELIARVERSEIVIIETPNIENVMGGAFCYAEKTTQDEFLKKLADSLRMVKKMGGMCPGDIEIATDGSGNFAAKMVMGR